MKVVVYSQQGGDTLSGIHSNAELDFTNYESAFIVKSEDGQICHFISCKDLDTIGIWQTNELDGRHFISACKNGRLVFMIVPDTDSDSMQLQDILNNCIAKIPN